MRLWVLSGFGNYSVFYFLLSIFSIRPFHIQLELKIMSTDSQFLYNVTPADIARIGYLIKAGANPKTLKSDKGGVYLTAIHNLSPGTSAVCPWATTECIHACLHTAGNPAYLAGKLRARLARTAFFFHDRANYIRRLVKEIAQHERRARKHDLIPAVRLNGTSDITWETIAPEVFASFPNVVFYDYTKGAHRLTADWVSRRMPPNYDLTLSFSGHNWDKCETALTDGGRVAAVFAIKRNQELPQWYKGWPVVDGDETDLTFTRPAASILGLRAKGKAITEGGAFVLRDIENWN